MKKRIIFRFLLFIPVLLVLLGFVAEFGAGVYLHTIEDFGNSVTDIRNPLFRRGWVEYTEKQPFEADKLIILVASSQAYFTESPDPTLSYPYLLQQLLNENSDQTVKLLSWATPGIEMPEYTLLMARLADYDPDLVLFIVDWKDFTDRLRQPFSTYPTDITRLAFNSKYRSYLSQEFLDAHDESDPMVWFESTTNLGRLIQHNADHTAWEHRPSDLDNMTYATEHTRNRRPRSWSEDSDWYLRDMMATYQRTAGDTPLIVVAMPRYLGWYKPEQVEEMDTLASQLERVLGEYPNVRVIDHSKTISETYFYTDSHFDPIGHGLFAEQLLDDILPTLSTDN